MLIIRQHRASQVVQVCPLCAACAALGIPSTCSNLQMMLATADMDAVLRTATFTCTIMDVHVRVNLTIKQTFETTMDFTLSGTAYTFNIVRWSRRGLTPFLELFFQHTDRDPEQFGTFSQDDEGLPDFHMTHIQKLNAVTQAAKDVMTCIDLIATKHQRSVLGYAVWYSEKYASCERYSKYITMLACNCIVNTHFLAPGVTWPSCEVVDFDMA